MKLHSPPKHPRGFTLTEVIIALGLFVFAITAIMGVIPFGLNQVQTANYESRATATMESIRDDLALALAGKSSGRTSLHDIIIPTGTGSTDLDFKIADDGSIITSDKNTSATPAYKIVGQLTRPQGDSPDPVYLNLRASWPANAPAGRETGSTELLAAFRP